MKIGPCNQIDYPETEIPVNRNLMSLMQLASPIEGKRRNFSIGSIKKKMKLNHYLRCKKPKCAWQTIKLENKV